MFVKHNCTYVHNQIADVINQTLIWMQEELLPRCRFATVSTYDKAVARIQQLAEEDPGVPPLPAITLDPQLITLSEGNLLWQFSQYATNPQAVLRNFEPIIVTDDFKIYPIFQTIKVDLEVILFLSSIYEYTDLSYKISDFFAINRFVRPRVMQSLIIVPSTLLVQEYTNPYTSTQYTIDLTSISSPYLIKSLSKDYVCFEALLTPKYQLTGISDAATKYGGDSIADWRLSFSMTMEVQMPTWFLFHADWKIESLDVKSRIANTFYPTQVSDDGRIIDRPLPVSDIANICDRTISNFYDRYIYTCDQDYSEGELTLELPLDLTSDLTLIVWSYGGEMDIFVHFTLDLSSSPNKITFNIPFKKNDTIEFYYFKSS